MLTRFPDDSAGAVARRVLDALEMLYFEQRGGVLGRSVESALRLDYPAEPPPR
jgi:hypothetical protein